MSTGLPEKISYYLEPGYIFCPLQPVSIHTVLGSCVAVCLWDTRRKAGGMSHFLLPSTASPEEATPRFGNVATAELIRMMEKNGSKPGQLLAQIIGGAAPQRLRKATVGPANIEVARSVLRKKGIRVCSEDVGGQMGRKVVFDTRTGHVMVLKVHQLRESDWIALEP